MGRSHAHADPFVCVEEHIPVLRTCVETQTHVCGHTQALRDRDTHSP